ncbi:MAG: M28 family peptidase [Candidatus Hodarchaeales archaeon]
MIGIMVIVTAVLIALFTGYPYQSTIPEESENWDYLSTSTSFNGTLAYEHARFQCEDIGYRYPGSNGINLTRKYIMETISNYPGWTVNYHNFTYNGIPVVNIIADWKCDVPDANITLIGAHYDTRLVADKDKTNPDEPVLGANDGASGIAVQLELARIIKETDINLSLRLLFIDAEDQGSGGMEGWNWIVGSQKYADFLAEDPDRIAELERVIILDMIGDRDLQIYYERNSNSQIMIDLWNIALNVNATAFHKWYKHGMIDDHIPFRNLGIPSVDIIDFDYPYHHTIEDTMDKIDSSSLEQVGKTIEAYFHFLIEKENQSYQYNCNSIYQIHYKRIGITNPDLITGVAEFPESDRVC